MNGEDVRTWEFWDALQARLSSDRMGDLLRGPARVYKGTAQPAEAEGPEADVWGRVVVASVETLWPSAAFVPGETRKLPFTVRAEVHAPPLEGNFDPARLLDAVHAEAHALLQGWAPSPFTHALVAVPVYRVSDPNPQPLWDDPRGLWFTSAEYRTELAPAPPTEV